MVGSGTGKIIRIRIHKIMISFHRIFRSGLLTTYSIYFSERTRTGTRYRYFYKRMHKNITKWCATRFLINSVQEVPKRAKLSLPDFDGWSFAFENVDWLVGFRFLYCNVGVRLKVVNGSDWTEVEGNIIFTKKEKILS